MATAESTEQPQDRSLLERILGVFTDVKAGEGVDALLMTLNIALLLTAYYVIKPVREGLILRIEGGEEHKFYIQGAIAVALLGAVPAYSAVARKLPRNRLVIGVTLFFVSHLVVFRILEPIKATEGWLGYVFFVWVGIFNMMVVAQFWAFAADIYNDEQGKRLFALIGIGASGGAVLGSFITDQLVLLLGIPWLLLVSAAILALCSAITQVVHVRKTRRLPEAIKKQLKNTVTASSGDVAKAIEQAKAATSKKGETQAASGAFSMVFRYRYLTLLAAFSLLFTFINSNSEYILGVIVKGTAQAELTAGALGADKLGEVITKLYGDFFLWVNVLGLVLQGFVVSRVVKLGGLKWAFLAFPLIALVDAAALAIAPIFIVARIFKTAENATDYSFNNTARNMLWLPTTRAMKYRAKQTVDAFFVRMGDVGAGLLVFAMAKMLQLGTTAFALANLALAGVTIVVCLTIIREQENLNQMRERGELPEDEPAEAS